MTALSAHSVSVSLAGSRILHDVSAHVGQGEWLGILGPNGAGKTTLVRAMGGLLPFEGTIELLGRAIGAWSDRERARQVALVAQSAPVYFDFTVLDLVMLGRAPHKHWLASFDRADRARALEAIAEVDLAGFEDRSILTLSGGERRRALLAQALTQDAQVLLLDEPTQNLDVHHEFAFMDCVRKLVAEGRSAVGVFHNLELAARFADRIVILDRGRVVAAGPPRGTLQPEIIREVFNMEASLTDRNGHIRIDFSGPA